MKVALINGSPKSKESISGIILQAVRKRLGNSHDYTVCDVVPFDKAQTLNNLKNCHAIIFAFPLYVDSIPSHLLRFLDAIKGDIGAFAPDVTVWAIANNGFYEGHQNAIALDMMQNFCRSAGLRWGQGIGVGAGGMVSASSINSGLMKNIGLTFDRLAENILLSRSAETQFAVPNFPRFLYKAAGNWGWKVQARKNGLKTKNILDKQA